MTPTNAKNISNQNNRKTLTGITGFDEITEGGIPRNRTTVLCGNTGCGKTVMSMEFLLKGAANFDEPGVFMSFEETENELVNNMESFNLNLVSLIKNKKIYIEYLEIDRTHVVETGAYNLEGLFVRLQDAITAIGAKRVVIDSLDALFFGLDNKILKVEIKRLFAWLKVQEITAIITTRMDSCMNTTDGLEQYIADCVIILDNRIINQTATRRLRIIKMRGSFHGGNEYPFIISSTGIAVLPLTLALKHHSLSVKRISSGIKDLDGMLDGKGFYQGSTILVSGSGGTAKTTIVISLIHAISESNVRSLFCAFEESPQQLVRNMKSVGLNLEPHLKSGALRFYSSRPIVQNLELHLISIQKIIEEFHPEIVVLDPITNLMAEGINSEVRQMLARFTDFLKSQNITTVFTAAITLETIKKNPSDEGISAMMDTWILVNNVEQNSERNRTIYVLKSRGMNHSTQVREFVVTDKGIVLLPIYISPAGILSGSAKLEQTLKEEAEDRLRDIKIQHEKNEIEVKQKLLEQNIALLKSGFDAEVDRLNRTKIENDLKVESDKKSKKEIIDLRNNKESSIEKLKSRNK